MTQQNEQTQRLKSIKIQRKVRWLYIAFVTTISLGIFAIVWRFIDPITWILRISGILYLVSFLYGHWLLTGNLVLFAAFVFILIFAVLDFILVPDKLDAIQGHWASVLRKRLTHFIFTLITLLIFGTEWFLSAANILPNSWSNFFYALFTVSLGILTLLLAILGAIIAYKQLHPGNIKLSDGTEGTLRLDGANLANGTVVHENLSSSVQGKQETNPSQSIPKDIFISYCKQDQEWAEWIARELNAAEFSTVLRAWESVQPGNNFKWEKDDDSKEARLTMLVLSPNYLKNLKAQSHWAVAFKEPQDLFLVVVHDYENLLPGTLQLSTSIDLVALNEATARQRLLSETRRLMNKQRVKHHFPVTQEDNKQHS